MQLMLEQLQALLKKVSRTFALNILYLPTPLVEAATLGYLLFRNIDTIEDAYQWSKEERIKELERFIAVVKQANNLALVREFTAKYKGEKRIENVYYLDLLYQTPFIMEQLLELQSEYPGYVKVITEYVVRMAKGMQYWVSCYDEHYCLTLQNLKQLQDYCYTAAGIVGEMLTTLFGFYLSDLEEERLLYLHTLEIDFATGLQLTNIIKNSLQDQNEGRRYLPAPFLPAGPGDTSDRIIPIFAYAYRYLIQGIEYTTCLPVEEKGIRKFCLIPVILAGATLNHLLKHRSELFTGEDLKISRLRVHKLLDQVDQVIDDNQQIREWWEQLTKPLKLASQQFTTTVCKT